MSEAEYRASLEAVYIDRPHHIDVMVAAWKAEREAPASAPEPALEGGDAGE
jgi:hypothetical protein